MEVAQRSLKALATFFCLLSAAAHADHETAEQVLGQWKTMTPRMHVLQPAAAPRELPNGKDPAATERVANDTQAMLKDSFSMLFIENGSIVFEGYAKGATPESQLHSQSMAKSMAALAVGEALCAGKIKSLDDPATNYVPQLEGTAYGAASLRNLLRYTSGAQDPGGNGYAGIHNFRDFGAVFQYQTSMLDLMKKYGGSSRFKPGEKYIYNGLDSEALSAVVRAATGMTMAAWFEQTVWQKAGGASQAGWFLDKDGNTVAQVSFYATTRDYARIALYVLDRLKGTAGDACIQAYLKEATSPLVSKGYWESAPSWGLGIHVGADGNPWFFGHGGQRVGIDVKAGRVIATNNHRDLRGGDRSLMGALAR